jgi:PAS domain S-box-containing protein
VGYLQVGFSLEPTNEAIHRATRASALVTLAGLGLGAILALWLSASVSRPILSLAQAAWAIGQGKLDTRVPSERRDELGLLAESINRMAENLSITTVSKSSVEHILASMAGSVLVLARDATIQRTNQATLHLLGYQAGELIGKPFSLVCANALFPDPGNEEAFETGLAVQGDVIYMAKDGRKIPMAFSASILREDHGQIHGFVCVAQDITERKQALEALAERERGSTALQYYPGAGRQPGRGPYPQADRGECREPVGVRCLGDLHHDDPRRPHLPPGST